MSINSETRFLEEKKRNDRLYSDYRESLRQFEERVGDSPRWKHVLTYVTVNVLLEKAIEELNNGWISDEV